MQDSVVTSAAGGGRFGPFGFGLHIFCLFVNKITRVVDGLFNEIWEKRITEQSKPDRGPLLRSCIYS